MMEDLKGAAMAPRRSSEGASKEPFVAIRFKVEGVDYKKLMGKAALAKLFQETMRLKLAEAGGRQLKPEMFEVVLSSGSVVVSATLPIGSLTSSALSALFRGVSSSAFKRTVAQAVLAMEGIYGVTQGSVAVSGVTVKEERPDSRSSNGRGSDKVRPASKGAMSTGSGSSGKDRLPPIDQGGLGKSQSTGSLQKPSAAGASRVVELPPVDPAAMAQQYAAAQMRRSLGSQGSQISRSNSAPSLVGSMQAPEVEGFEFSSAAGKEITVELMRLREELRTEVAERHKQEERMKELERQLRLAKAQAKRRPSPPKKPKRFGIASGAPYSKEQELPPKVPTPKHNKAFVLPSLRQLPPAPTKEERQLAAEAEALAARQAAAAVSSDPALSRHTRSMSRLDAIAKLDKVGLSTWEVRRAEKVARLQELDAFSVSMWDSFFDWQSAVDCAD